MNALQHLNKYFFKYRFFLSLGFVFVCLSNLFGIFSAQVIRHAVDLIEHFYGLFVMLPNSSASNFLLGQLIGMSLLTLAFMYFVFQAIKGLFMFFMRQTIIVTSRKVEYDLKAEIFDHFQKLPMAFYKENRVGDLMTRITEDVTKVRMYAGPGIMYTMNLISLFSITITVMFMVNIELSIYSLIPLPFLSFLIYKVSNLIYKNSQKIQARLSVLTNITQEVFSGIRVVKSYTLEERKMDDFADNSNSYKSESVQLAKVEAIFFPLVILLIGLSSILTIYIGGKQVIEGNITYGNIVEFIYYINLLTWPVTAVGWIASLIQRAKVSQARINEFLETEPIDNKEDVVSNLDGEFKLENLQFTYSETGIQALKGINLTINKGQKIAIVGKTGSGKSTLVNLLLRNYEEYEGSIHIDSKAINGLNLQSYRSHLGYVPQDHFLFSDSIKNNIAFGPKNYDEATILNYAKIAGLEKDLDGFENGLETVIGERGISLSGGQKQRITIARALIKQPKVLLLDDCLSAVDVKTEHTILNNLHKEFDNKTVILITHRTLSLSKMDQIIYLDNGQIAEKGSFDELLAQKGKFYQLHQQQKLASELKK